MPIYVNNNLIKSFIFPGGECHVKYDDLWNGYNYGILAYLNDANDIMKLLLIVDTIKRNDQDRKIYLTTPYFPYARQDRICNEGDPLSVKVMANLINSLGCHSITIYDPHSDVVVGLLDNCYVKSSTDIIIDSPLRNFIIDNNLILVSPDTGAIKKVADLQKHFAKDIRIIQANKIRNPLIGEIEEVSINDNVLNKNLIIIDDICDGGATFIKLGELLRDKGAKKLYLYVTHGIFSKGLDVLKPHFDAVYCYHTMLSNERIDPTFLTILGE